jgi:hypothetical protein
MSNTVTSAFIDLATFDEIEKYLYNGPTAVTYFVRCVRKSTWFAQVPVPLTQNAGNPDFGGDVAFQISRAGDYLIYVFLRFTTPAIEFLTVPTSGDQPRARWVQNLAHNLIDLTWISFNDLKVQEFDSFWLDMWAAHTVTQSKRAGYQNMIGQDLQVLGQQGALANGSAGSAAIPEYTFNLPLPYFFTRDTGIALPTAALPYNEMRIQFEFRRLDELLVLEGPSAYAVFSNIKNNGSLKLKNVQLWANYAVVSNEERVKMGKCPRDMVIEQVQRHGGRSYQANAIGTDSNQSFDIRMSHSIKALFWNVQNTTVCKVGGAQNLAQNLSNYTTRSACSCAAQPDGDGCDDTGLGISQGQDPVRLSSLLYENTYRLFEMGSDYFSLVQQFYHWDVIPDVTGYHSYSFALKPTSMDPTGSTNFGKLTNVSLQLTPSQDAVLVNATPAPQGVLTQSFQLYVRSLNFNIVRVSGGALGLPVL